MMEWRIASDQIGGKEGLKQDDKEDGSLLSGEV